MVNKHGRLILLVSLILLFLSVLLGLCFGSNNIGVSEILSSLLRSDKNAVSYRIIMHVRLPRVLGALLSGSALAVSGAILQAVLNNPLTGPNIIGINTGAGLLVLIAAVFMPSWQPVLPMVAFIGALATAFIILAIASGINASRLGIVLIGFAISSIFGSGMNLIMILHPDAYIGAGNFLTGGLASVTINHIRYPAVYICAGLLAAVLFSRDLNIISLGKNTAKSLGMNVNMSRFFLIAIAAVLAGAAVSFAGLLGFVGLVTPHVVRFFTGWDNRWVIPVSAVCGGAFVVLCDLVARTAFSPYEIPVGILMSLTGGPFFIFLIIKNRKTSYD